MPDYFSSESDVFLKKFPAGELTHSLTHGKINDQVKLMKHVPWSDNMLL